MAKSRKPVNDALDRLAAAERNFLAREFLAPVVRGGEVHVRIAGVICMLRVTPADFQGFGVFQPRSATAATLVRRARLAERQAYLRLFPLVRLIVIRFVDGQCRAIAAHRGDARVRLTGAAEVLLAEDVQPFETIQCRFDGARFWFDAADPRRDPAIATYLRKSLADMVPPDDLSRPGMSAEERTAYGILYWPQIEALRAVERARIEALRDWNEERLRAALAHAGAELSDYLERGDVYQVRYVVDGQQHVSIVRKQDLTVHSAGICLSGQDANFDLASLVSVMREAEN